MLDGKLNATEHGTLNATVESCREINVLLTGVERVQQQSFSYKNTCVRKVKIRRPSKHTTVFWIWNATLDASTCPQTLVFARQTIRRSDSLESFQSQIMCRAQSRSICQNCTPVAFNLPSYIGAHLSEKADPPRPAELPPGADVQDRERRRGCGEESACGRAGSD